MFLWLQEHRLDVDGKILDKFDRFFYENEPFSLTEKSPVQKLREAAGHVPEQDSDAIWRRSRIGI